MHAVETTTDAKAAPSADAVYIAEVRARYHAIVDGAVVTPALVANEAGINPSRLSQWAREVYKGDNLSTARDVDRWIDTYEARREAQAELPIGPAFVMTPTAEKVMNAVAYAHHAGDIVLIYGGAGVGKTSTINQYKSDSSGICVVTFTPAHNTLRACLAAIANCVGVQVKPQTNYTFDVICASLVKRKGLLIIDEAQHLSAQVLDMIRAIHDRTGCGIVFSGNELVYTNMTSGDRAAYLDRLSSRVGMRVLLKRSTQADVRSLAASWGIDDDAVMKVLNDIGTKPGGLRGVTKVLKLAHMFANNEPIAARHVRKAFNQLNGVSA